MHEDDAGDLLALYGDPLVMQYTDEAPFPDLATVSIMLASVRKLLVAGDSLEWAVALSDADELIGTCGLHSFDSAEAEIGCLLKRACWGKGYMSEAIGMLMDYARNDLQIRQLKADIMPANDRAQHLFRKLGYSPVDPSTLRKVLR